MVPGEDFGFGGGESLPFGILASNDTDGDHIVEAERLVISGRRVTPAIVEFQRSNEFNPDRDAIMLHAFLSTTLDAETWQKFVTNLVMNSPISHQVIQQMIGNPQILGMMMGFGPSSKSEAPPRKRKPRAPRKPRATAPIVESED